MATAKQSRTTAQIIAHLQARLDAEPDGPPPPQVPPLATSGLLLP